MRCVSPPMGRVQPPPLLFSCISMQTGRVQSPSPLFSTTALKHLPWHHHRPPPLKMSKHTHFWWRWLLSRPTVPHHPRKQAYVLVFIGGSSPAPPVSTTLENEHTFARFCGGCSPGPPLSPTTHENEHTCSCLLAVVVLPRSRTRHPLWVSCHARHHLTHNKQRKRPPIGVFRCSSSFCTVGARRDTVIGVLLCSR